MHLQINGDLLMETGDEINIFTLRMILKFVRKINLEIKCLKKHLEVLTHLFPVHPFSTP